MDYHIVSVEGNDGAYGGIQAGFFSILLVGEGPLPFLLPRHQFISSIFKRWLSQIFGREMIYNRR